MNIQINLDPVGPTHRVKPRDDKSRRLNRRISGYLPNPGDISYTALLTLRWRSTVKRRGFVKLCATAVAGITANPELLARDEHEYHRYGRVVLVDPHSQAPVSLASLEVGETYLFHYPFVSTPCFLIDLGRPVEAHINLKTSDGNRYRWNRRSFRFEKTDDPLDASVFPPSLIGNGRPGRVWWPEKRPEANL